MPIDLHLFSTPGNHDDIEWVVDAVRSTLKGKPDPVVAYLPLASLVVEPSIATTQEAFRGLARVETINTETMELPQMESILRRAAVVYIPGGNTFLLNHRLHVSQLFPYLRKKLESGLPLVGVSAGAVACGPNILASNDLNMLPTPHFDGFNLTAFNFNMHYADDPRRDNWLMDYRAFHDNPVILMEDGSYIKVHGKQVNLARGPAWVWHAGHEKERLEPGCAIPVRA